ncbi:MAG: hypothetical protein WCH77_09565 [Planctomycetota bacterium]
MSSVQANLLEMLRLLKVKRPAHHNMLRVGSCADGGYLLCHDLEGLNAALSFGIGDEVSFDLQLANLGLDVYQFDHTVLEPPTTHERFHFQKIAWGPRSGLGVTSLEQIVTSNAGVFAKDCLLKFDVEGAEWQSIDSTPVEVFRPFRFIIGEFHCLSQAVRPDIYALFMRVFRKLLANHSVIHTHANNACSYSIIENVPVPDLLEVTFYRNDRDNLIDYSGPLPCELDFPNMPGVLDIILRP